MKITALDLQGAFLVELDRIRDERGFFARAWCHREFATAGIRAEFVQANVSHTSKKGSVRGMHYQEPPSKEGKLIRCVQGAIHDVVVDIRPGSSTFLQSLAVELSSVNGLAIFIPNGFAHGFQTLADDVDVFYQMSDEYEPDLANGFRYDDPLIAIEWPLPVTIISDRDAAYPDITAQKFPAF